MGDLLFTDSTQILSYLGLHTADKGYYSVYQSAFGQKWDFPASFPLASRSFPRRAPVSRESGQFSFSKLFFSTNHCTARGIVSLLDPWIFTKSAAISLFTLRFAWNSELKLLSASCFEPRGHFLVLFVRLFVNLDTAKLFLNWFWFSLGLPFRSVKPTMISVIFFQIFKGFTLLPWQKVGRILLGFAGNPSNFQISPLFACISLQFFPSLSLCIRTINV